MNGFEFSRRNAGRITRVVTSANHCCWTEFDCCVPGCRALPPYPLLKGEVAPYPLLRVGASVVNPARFISSIIDEMKRAGLPTDAPTRSNGYGATSPFNNGYGGNARQPGTQQSNSVQQQWFADVTTRVILPAFRRENSKPFMLLYWSRDPDGTQ